jgi:hypothetical protein
LVAEPTALINQLRSLMLERGITVPQGRCKLERHLPEILWNERNGLTPTRVVLPWSTCAMMLQQSGAFRENQRVVERAMDSNSRISQAGRDISRKIAKARIREDLWALFRAAYTAEGGVRARATLAIMTSAA